MRGNRLARRGDPMKTRSERRRERKKKISSSSWAQRARKRLCRVIAKRCAREEDSHMTAIMQSYAIRRKAQRDAERAAERNTEEASQSTDQDHQESVEGKAPRSRGGDVREGLSVSAAKSRRRVDARRYPGREAKALRERQSKARTQSLY